MAHIPDNQTREQILKVAEELFSKRGYAAVTLRDIAAQVGMRHASLYYYAPDGKEGLYVEVMKRSFNRYRVGVTQAIAEAGDDLAAQMNAVAKWILTQPPMDLARMVEADFPALHSETAKELKHLAIESLSVPIIHALKRADESGTIVPMPNHGMAAMAFTVLIQSTHHIPDEAIEREVPGGREQIAHALVHMLLYGWLPR